MTSRPVRRRGARPFADGLHLDAGMLLGVLILIGLLLRALIAGILLPKSGFRIDIVDFSAWGQRLASVGPGAFYAPGYFSDYPPGYLYVLWGLGLIGKLLAPLVGQDATSGLIKIPGILADAGVAWLLFAYGRRFLDRRFTLAGRSWSGEAVGLVAAAIYLFNPATVFNSAVWGQVDSVGTLVILGTLYALAAGWTEAAALGATIALLVKFQYAFLIPIVAIVGIKRHLLGRSADPGQDLRRDPLRVLTSVAVGIGALVLLLAPFGMSVWSPSSDPNASLIGKFGEAATTYEGLAINAINLWRNAWSGLGDTLRWGCDVPAVAPDLGCGGPGIAIAVAGVGVSWQLLGTLLFAVAALIALWQVWRHDDPEGLVIGTLLVAVAFFVVPTRVHERYLFPAVGLAAPLVLRAVPRLRRSGRLMAFGAAAVVAIGLDVVPGFKLVSDGTWPPWFLLLFPLAAIAAAALLLRFGWAALYGLVTVSLTANVLWVYTADWTFAGLPPMNPGFGDGPMDLGPFFDGVIWTDAGLYLLGIVVVVAFGWLAWRVVREAPAVEPAWAAEDGPRVSPGAMVMPPVPRVPAREPASVEERSREDDPLFRERGRRLDRLDALLLVGLVGLGLLFRLWRLDVPQGYHFDEVYHARSAMEWLSDWEHGWTRDTYEWTHPMLAKYLIAAGIVAMDPNQVRATTELGAAGGALAVAPARNSQQHPRSVAFTVESGQIVGRDALDGGELSRWSAGGPIASLAWDGAAQRLLAGRADDGTVQAYDLAAYLPGSGPRAPPPAGVAWATDLGSVNEIVVSDDGTAILARGPDRIARLDPAGTVISATATLASGGLAYLPKIDQAAPLVLSTDAAGGVVNVLDATTLEPAQNQEPLQASAPPVGPVIVQGSGNDAQVWVPVGPQPGDPGTFPATGGGIAVYGHTLTLIGTTPLPGTPRQIAWEPVVNMIYVTGVTDDGGAPVVWAVEPHGESGGQGLLRSGFAAWDSTALPGESLAIAVDAVDTGTGDDNAQILVVSAPAAGGTAGALVSVDTRGDAVAWRMAGVIFGSILVGLIYLLAATMFRRRRIAVLAAIFVAVDGMSYVMSRIAMNDIFTATFIIAAYLLFWQVWSGRWRGSAWWALPLTGVLIGLAAASKWVGFYALAGLLILVLVRSPLGRLLLVGAIGFLLIVAGIDAPWPVLVVCAAAFAIAILIVWRWPIRLRGEELLALPATGLVLGGIGLAFALAYGQVAGRQPKDAIETIFAFLSRGAQAAWPAWIMLGATAVLVGARAVKSLRTRDDARWWAPEELGGFSWPWIGACLVILPLTVYFLTYVPYLALGHTIATPDVGPGYAWSLDELHAQMFGYHFGLTAGHPSSSPWWSWPLDLKPTWFYGHGYDDRSTAAIYNGGNPILLWAGIPALVFAGIMAWRRRSLALVLVVVAFAFQFLPWTRIERATFMYHYFTAMLFAMLALAYAVDELLVRPDWRPYGVAFLSLAAVAGILVFPLGSALAMPDWYINAARALPPWNYAFQFPAPPSGDRTQLVSGNLPKLVAGLAVGFVAAVFALLGRDRWEIQRARRAASAAAGEGGDHDEQPRDEEADRPDPRPRDVRNVLGGERPGPDDDEDPPDDEGPVPRFE